MYNNKTYETHIITSPNKRDVAVQRVYKILEEIKSKNLLPYILKLSALENEIKSMNHSKYEEEIEKIFSESKQR